MRTRKNKKDYIMFGFYVGAVLILLGFSIYKIVERTQQFEQPVFEDLNMEELR